MPGPPKRFAQSMGAVISTSALILWLAGATTGADVLLVMLVAAAGLESILAYCLGCKVFGICAIAVPRVTGRPAHAEHQPARPAR
ncbi:MAG TPA: DUF4395 family protein [Solirubrobacteraceae bacterium]|nr:DUF4395 family protein [Solirubrobacteraceae bacterium]